MPYFIGIWSNSHGQKAGKTLLHADVQRIYKDHSALKKTKKSNHIKMTAWMRVENSPGGLVPCDVRGRSSSKHSSLWSVGVESIYLLSLLSVWNIPICKEKGDRRGQPDNLLREKSNLLFSLINTPTVWEWQRDRVLIRVDIVLQRVIRHTHARAH